MRPSLLKTWLSQNVWQQSMFGHFFSLLAYSEQDSWQTSGPFYKAILGGFCKRVPKLSHWPYLSMFPCPLPSHHPGCFQVIPFLFWFLLLFCILFHYLCVRVEQQNLPFLEIWRTQIYPFEDICSLGQWELDGFWHMMMIIFLTMYPTRSRKQICSLLMLFTTWEGVCVTVINAVLIRLFSFGLLKQSFCGSTCRRLDRKYMISS